MQIKYPVYLPRNSFEKDFFTTIRIGVKSYLIVLKWKIIKLSNNDKYLCRRGEREDDISKNYVITFHLLWHFSSFRLSTLEENLDKILSIQVWLSLLPSYIDRGYIFFVYIIIIYITHYIHIIYSPYLLYESVSLV